MIIHKSKDRGLVMYSGFESKWIHFFIENPFRTWWKVRRYFKMPKLSFHLFTHPVFNCPYATYKWIGNLIDISICDVGWKTKYDEIRFERNPYIWICFFRRFGFSINFYTYYKNEFNEKQPMDDQYWEYLLDYIYRDNNLAKNIPTWVGTSKLYKEVDYETDTFKFKDYIIPVIQYSLTKKGIKKLKEDLKIIQSEKSKSYDNKSNC